MMIHIAPILNPQMYGLNVETNKLESVTKEGLITFAILLVRGYHIYLE